MKFRSIFVAVFLLFVSHSRAEEGNRWYSDELLIRGTDLFKQNCETCHGLNAEATTNWKQTDANGNYPPPPLNGTAHAWHHSKDLLKKTILEGGANIGGLMPSFSGQLSSAEVDAVIAYFQSKWPDELYQKWDGRFQAGESLPNQQVVKKAESTPVDLGKITKLLKMRLNSDNVTNPVKTPVEGIYQIQFGRNYAYLADEGRYLFMADLIDLEQDQNLTNNAKRKVKAPADKPLSVEVAGIAENRKMTDLLKLRLGSSAVSKPVKTPVEGIYQTRFGINFAYLTRNGRYVFMGNLIDLERGQNLTDIAKRVVVKGELNQFATEDKAIFPAKGEEKAVINVFTDTSCITCKKLFVEVPKLQDAGISVQYLPFPDEGPGSPGYQTLKQVWCAEDKAKALTIGKGLEDGILPAGNCLDANLVDESYALGKKLGVIGTPAIFKQNGEHIKGYVPYQELIPRVLKN